MYAMGQRLQINEHVDGWVNTNYRNAIGTVIAAHHAYVRLRFDATGLADRSFYNKDVHKPTITSHEVW